jgi:tRNA-dihydrouridine synthase
LKRKENAPIVSFEFLSVQKSTIPDETIKRNNINMLSHRFCIAPMMDWTDRHCRVFHRLMTRHARLYTEMLTTAAVIHGDRQRLLGFDASSPANV